MLRPVSILRSEKMPNWFPMDQARWPLVRVEEGVLGDSNENRIFVCPPWFITIGRTDYQGSELNRNEALPRLYATTS